MVKQLSVLLVLFGLFTPISNAADGISPPITLTTWNLNWLSGDMPIEGQHANIPPRTPRDYQAMAGIIKDISPDVLAFQEVASRKALAQILPLDSYQIEFSTRQDKNNTEIWPQFVGFAIRNGIQFQRHPDLHQLDVWGNQYLRYGVDITLYHDAKPALRLLTVHLKSGCFSNRHRNKSCPVLNEQFEILDNWIAARHAQRQHFVIMGDFNRRLAESGDKFWQKLSSDRHMPPALVTNGLDSDCRSQVYNKRKKQWDFRQYRSFIDHFIIDGQILERNTKLSFSEYQYSDQQLRQYQLSDHCPLSITLQHQE